MKSRLTALVIIILAGSVSAQTDNGRKNIEKLCGCFSVNFRYAETFSPDDKYKFHEREDMNAMELALPIEMSDKKISIQHLLIVRDSMIIKHWREDWIYEAPELISYTHYKTWEKRALTPAETKGKWTQTVWEVSDEPRYQGYSAWITNDGKTYWENTADAPLPRREYTTRNDYNILRRTNRIIVTDSVVTHVQDNAKIMRSEQGDKLIAEEKGFNTYYRQPDSDCAQAKLWWEKNKAFWEVVRAEWSQYLSMVSAIKMRDKVEDKMMHEYFAALYKEWKGQKIKDDELRSSVQQVMGKFILSEAAQ